MLIYKISDEITTTTFDKLLKNDLGFRYNTFRTSGMLIKRVVTNHGDLSKLKQITAS
jgi:hypothetical protein